MWKDVTSHSRDAKEREPTTYETKNGIMRLVITNAHVNYRGIWIMHCYVLGLDTIPMRDCKTKEEAQKLALDIVERRLESLRGSFAEIR